MSHTILSCVTFALVLSFAQPRHGVARVSGAQTEAGQDAEKVYARGEVDKPAKILFKPAPQPVVHARLEGGRGSIMIEAVLSASGVLKEAKVVRPLPEAFTKEGQEAKRALTENALRAVHGVKFEPAVKDGQPVSQRMKFEYSYEYSDNISDKTVVGDSSKRVYYSESCTDFSRIERRDMVHFYSAGEAKKAGYKKAKSKCPR